MPQTLPIYPKAAPNGCNFLTAQKKPGKCLKRHTGRDAVEIRYPVKVLFFLDFGYPPAADSGMTGLVATRKTLSFSSAFYCS
jgi:hypothetical protein